MPRNRILAGLVMLAVSLVTLYSVVTESPYVTVAIGVEVMVVLVLLVALRAEKLSS